MLATTQTDPVDSWNQARSNDQIRAFVGRRLSALAEAEVSMDEPELELPTDLQDFFAQYRADSY